LPQTAPPQELEERTSGAEAQKICGRSAARVKLVPFPIYRLKFFRNLVADIEAEVG
jgi:hypothetical protein